MESNNKKSIISQDDIMKLLNSSYDKCINGVPKVIPGVEKMANEYLEKYPTKEKACQAMIRDQVHLCAATGALTGLGGIVTMPITLPTNMLGVFILQMRMVACAAHMAGHTLESERTRSAIYSCLAGITIAASAKKVSTEIGMKFSTQLIKKIPGRALTQINQAVGFRLVTAFGSTGVINLGKAVPGIGAVVGGAFDYTQTRGIGKRAYKWFFEDDLSVDENNGEVIEIIELSEEDIIEAIEK